jgi:hypothetical protein
MNDDMFRLYAPMDDYAKHIIKPCLALIDVAAEDAPADVKRQLENRVKKWFVSLNPQNNTHSDSDPESHKVPEQPTRDEEPCGEIWTYRQLHPFWFRCLNSPFS